MAQNDPKWPKMTSNGPKMTPGFTHFFHNFFLTEKAVPQTFSLLECMDLLMFCEKFASRIYALLLQICQWLTVEKQKPQTELHFGCMTHLILKK